jgi:DNA (cytosine-5)-methyltransferase 1
MKKLLDLYCGAGGCSVGYHNAGFEVTGVDINEQPNYPFELIVSDVFELPGSFFDEFDVIHASPPCQAYSWSTKRIRNKGGEYLDLLGETREFLIETGKPYIIENVVGSPLINPIKLCGTMFDLKVIRHRLFESTIKLYPPRQCNHNGTVRDGTYVTVSGHGGDSKTFKFKDWSDAMGISWMTKYELTQSIPPKYTEHLGKLIMEEL